MDEILKMLHKWERNFKRLLVVTWYVGSVVLTYKYAFRAGGLAALESLLKQMQASQESAGTTGRYDNPS